MSTASTTKLLQKIKRQEEEIKRIKDSEVKIREIVESLNYMVYEFDTKWHFNYANDTFYKLTGYSKSEINKKAYWEIIRKDFRDDVIHFYQSQIKKKKRSSYMEFPIIDKKANEIWIAQNVNLTIEKGEITSVKAVAKDITEQKNAERDELKGFVEAAPAEIVMLDTELRVIAASEKWYDKHKLKNKNIVKRRYDVIFPDLPTTWKNILHRGLKGAIESEDEEKFVSKGGKITWLKWEMRPWFTISKEIGGIIIMTEDITAQKCQEDELKEAKENAIQASRAKAEFLSVMSHEIRTPLNAVIGMIRLLEDEDPKPSQLNNLKVLRFSADNLLLLINDILDYNKIEAGKIIIDEQDFDLKMLVTSIRQSLMPSVKEKNIQFKISYDLDIPEVLIGDQVRLGQVLSNLVTNAVKFTHEGYVKMDVSLVKETSKNVTLHFAVEDTGIGIKKESLKHIFDSFSQAEVDTSRKYGGTGLGLSIIKGLLNLFGSEIQVETKAGKGSKFFFDIDLKKSGTPFREIAPKRQNNSMHEDFSNLKILLVEDNEINQLIACRFLDKWNAQTDLAENGKEAVENVKKNDYDLVLMDLHMPEMDGYEATKIIRKMRAAKYKSLPIIALSASASLSEKNKVITMGMNDYIPKPFNPDDLFKKIEQYTNQPVESNVSKKKVKAKSNGSPVSFIKLEALAENNLPFLNKLCVSYIKMLDEFQVDYKSSLISKNFNKFKEITHAASSSIKFLELTRLESEILKVSKLIESKKVRKDVLEKSIGLVESICLSAKQAIQAKYQLKD